jgi:hypothetical protein
MLLPPPLWIQKIQYCPSVVTKWEIFVDKTLNLSTATGTVKQHLHWTLDIHVATGYALPMLLFNFSLHKLF